jgi:hypothetical protein
LRGERAGVRRALAAGEAADRLGIRYGEIKEEDRIAAGSTAAGRSNNAPAAGNRALVSAFVIDS